MRGIFQDITQPLTFKYTAGTDFTMAGQPYRRGEIFSFSGSSLRFTGLARPALLPSYIAEQLRLTWFSPINRSDGYGSLAEQAALGLLDRGVDLSMSHLGTVDLDATSPRLAVRLTRPLSMREIIFMMCPPDTGIIGTRVLQSGDPQTTPLFKNQFRILYTMFETDRLPDGFAGRINFGADAVMVPSSFLIESFRRAGVTIPIYLAPAGLNGSDYAPGPRQLARWQGTPVDDQIRVLLAGTLTRRKNAVDAIRAFQKAAGSDPRWHLTIKTQAGHAEFVEFVLKPVVEAADPRIELVTERLSRPDLIQLYQDNDLFLWPSLGEGIGLPPLEAMACGLETVAGMHSGALDYLNDETAYPVKSRLEPALDFQVVAGSDEWTNVGNWWRPEAPDLVRQLKAAAAALTHPTRLKGSRASTYVAENFAPGRLAASIHHLLTTQILPEVTARKYGYPQSDSVAGSR